MIVTQLLEWVVKNAKQLGIDPTSIGVGGDSAGGNLASAVALKARNENLIKLAFQLLIYPCNDNKMKYQSAIDNSEGLGLTTKSMLWFSDQYLQNKQDHTNPYAVPAIASSLSKVAPAIVLASQYDPLTDDAKNYYRRLIEDGVSAIYKEYPGQIHGLFNLGGVTSDADLMYSDIAAEIKAMLGRN
jgi:acetyl esterase